MGLTINIYKNNQYGDCTNNGVSSWDVKGLCITNIDAPFSPSDEYPSAELVVQEHFNRKTVKIVPTAIGKRHSMFGGNYGACSDSRFSDTVEKMLGHSFYGAIPIHDRVE
tara:strand:- start:607 stop:936 length:330 start_codon:yes stop_codon:yes gene_type:complete